MLKGVFTDLVSMKGDGGISPLRKRAQTNTAGVYTWTFSKAFDTGILPVISICVEDSGGASYNTTITALSNSSVTVAITKTTSVVVLGTTVLGVSLNPQAYVHITALSP